MALTNYNLFDSANGNGTTITAGNSGGAAGIAWDLMTASGTGASAVFSTSSPIRGTQSGVYTVGSTSTTAKSAWTSAGSLGGTYSRLQGMFGVQPLTSLPSVQTAVHRFTAAGSQAARFTVDASGTVSLRNTSSSLITGATSSGTMTTSSQWYIKYDITFGSSGSGTIFVFYSLANANANTPDETLTFSSANLLSTAIDAVEFGVCAGTTNASIKIDDAYVTDQGVPFGPALSGAAAGAFGLLSGSGAGSQVVNASAAGAFGALSGSAAGIVGQTILGVGAGAFGALAGTGAGSIGSSTVLGAGSGAFGPLAGTAAGKSPVFGFGVGSFGALTGNAQVAMPVWTYTPPQRRNVVALEGSLRYSFQVSETVWKDANGVWQHQETPSNETLAAASVLLAVSGRPIVVSAALAAELALTGIGSVSVSFG